MKYLLCLAVAVLTLAACQTLPEKQPVTDAPIEVGGAEWRTTDTLLVVTDASLSTYNNESFPDAQALTRAYVASLPAPSARAERQGPYRVGATSFGGSSRRGAPIAAYDAQALGQAMADLRLIGKQSPLDAVLDDAAATIAGLNDPGRVALVVISDGVADDAGRALEAGRNLIGSIPGGVCIHAVQVGSDSEGAAFMATLAALSGCGSSRNASSLQTAGSLEGFTRSTMLGAALPQVAARKIVLRGVTFDFDKSTIRAEDAAVLEAAIEALQEMPGAKLRISGHTDSIGTDAYNEALSVRRAVAVREFLSNHGVEAQRLEAAGHGPASPVASNDTADGRAQNRRVEFEVRQ